MNQYFIITNQIKNDGVVNNSIISRNSFATALAEYFLQCSKAPTNVNYVNTSVALMDDHLNVVKKEDIEGSYVAETTE